MDQEAAEGADSAGDACVACPLHERRYALRSGEDLAGGKPVGSYPVEVRDGIVYWSPSRGGMSSPEAGGAS